MVRKLLMVGLPAMILMSSMSYADTSVSALKFEDTIATQKPLEIIKIYNNMQSINKSLKESGIKVKAHSNNEPVSRIEVFRELSKLVPASTNTLNVYNDVVKDYLPHVNAVVDAGIVPKVLGSIKPDLLMTRIELEQYLTNLVKYKCGKKYEDVYILHTMKTGTKYEGSVVTDDLFKSYLYYTLRMVNSAENEDPTDVV